MAAKTRNINETTFDKLRTVESQISLLCQPYRVPPNELENHLNQFSFDEQDELLVLLREKLMLQKAVFKMQGGSLDNVVFLSAFR